MQRAPKAICLNRQEGAASTDLVCANRNERKDNSLVKYAAQVQHIWFNINTHTHHGLKERHRSGSSECVNRKLDNPVCPPSSEENVSVANMLQRLLREQEGSASHRVHLCHISLHVR